MTSTTVGASSTPTRPTTTRRRRTASRTTAPTLTDVAQLAGVSTSTASRALNDHPTVDPDRAARIRAAADQLGYVIDATARAVSGGATATIALVLGAADPSISVTLVHGVTEAALTHGIAVLVAGVDLRSADAAAAVRQLRAHRPRCIIIVDPNQPGSSQELAGELDQYRRQGGQILWARPPHAPSQSATDHHHQCRRLGVAAVRAALSDQAVAQISAHHLGEALSQIQHRSESRTP
jgi:DNA-binding LacI/PurR family transcriptional regulator